MIDATKKLAIRGMIYAREFAGRVFNVDVWYDPRTREHAINGEVFPEEPPEPPHHFHSNCSIVAVSAEEHERGHGEDA